MYVCMYVCVGVCMYVYVCSVYVYWPINKGALISGRLLAEVYCMNRIVSSGQAHQSVR